ncbi:MAG: ribosome silencing factor [Thiobacillaceae bacterium]
MDTETLTRIAVAALEDIKGKEITVLDVRHLTSLFDRLIIASGESSRQVKALADNVVEKLKAAGATIIGTEGERAAEWILVDAGDVVIHVMQPAVRAHYNLEELWGTVARERAAA